ncbi:MAG: tetratricopeptide repeat protein [Hyphomicrobiales bacterium]|nr:tetratricopeptide repeat protein [Hyphomicrobiales bacterium]
MARQLKKTSPEELLAEAQSAIVAKDWPQAISAFETLLAAFDPAPPPILYNLGLALKHSGQRYDALERFEQTLAQDPNHLNAQYERASALMDLGFTRVALDAFTIYLGNAPDDMDAKRNCARLLTELGHWEKARIAWSDFDPDTDDEAALMAIKLSSELGETDKALALAKKLAGKRQNLRADILQILSHSGTGVFPMQTFQIHGQEFEYD